MNISGGLQNPSSIPDGTVTLAKLADIAADSLIGGGNGGAGPPQVITLGTNLVRVGSVLNATGGSGGDLALTKKAPESNITVTAGWSAYVSSSYECMLGVSTEVGAGATLEVG